MNKKKINTQELLEFCTKNGINVKVDYNPSPERIAEIKKKIERNHEKLKNAMFTTASKGIGKILKLDK